MLKATAKDSNMKFDGEIFKDPNAKIAFAAMQDFFMWKNELRDSSKNIEIARIFNTKYFYELVELKELKFIKPELWADPLENLFLKKSDNKIRWDGSNLYGLCWTNSNYSNGNFEKYLNSNKGVRVFTNISKIRDAIVKYDWKYSGKDFYSGFVRYLDQDIVEKYIKSAFVSESNKMSDTAFIRASCLFLKNSDFCWEKEFRVVIENQTGIKNQESTFGIPIEPNNFIDKIEVDPRMNSSELEEVTHFMNDAGLIHLLQQET